MSYTLKYTGSEIDDILDRAAPSGALDTAIATKQDALTFDDAPTSGSDNPVKSGGIYDAIQAGGAAALAAFATDSVSGDVVSFPDGADGIPVKSFTGSIIPAQSGSGDPAPDNIRPISGWTGANITRCGRNIYDESYAGLNTGSTVRYYPLYVGANKTVVASSTIPLSGGSNVANLFILSGNVSTGASTNNNGVFNGTPRTATADADGYVTLGYRIYNSVNPKDYPLMVEYGTTPTAYEPYTADTILLSFGQTVYAGTLTALGGGLWKIQPTYAIVDLGSLTWVTSGSVRFKSEGLASVIKPVASQSDTIDAYCSMFKVAPYGTLTTYEIGVGTTGNVFIGYPQDTPLATFVANITGEKFCYPLATLPAPITITGEDLQTLLGANSIWQSCGSVTELTYRADTALYIDKKLGA